MNEYTVDQIENIVAYAKAKKAYRKAIAKVVRLETYRKTYGADMLADPETRAHLTLARCEEKRAWTRMVAAMGVCPLEAQENPGQVLKESGHGPVRVDRISPENFPYEEEEQEDDLS